jgi:uncharacterized protein YjeT (DUF2065 family)
VTDFLAAVALVLVMEGLAYAAFGGRMKQGLSFFLSLPTSTIRAVGLAVAATGLILLWVIRG